MKRIFSFNAYPIWLKLLLIVGIALLALLIPATLLLRTAVDDVAVQQGSSYVSQVGSEQSATVSNNITQAELNLTSFVTDPENERILTSLLVGGVRTDLDVNLPDVRDQDVADLIESTILNPATTLYESVRLINRDGEVVARAELTTSIGLSSNDESGSAAFLQAQAAALAGQTNALTIDSVDGIGVIEYSQAVQWRDGRILGYVIGRISNTRAIYPNLRYPPTGYEGFSYLESPQGIVISPADQRFQVVGGSTSALVNAGLSGATGTQQFAVEGVDFIGYYTPVRGAPLALIAQIPLSEPLADASQAFNTRNFVLLLGGGLVVIVVAVLAQLLFAAPLGRLRRSADAISAGDLNTPIPDIERGDEIGHLAGSMEAMRGSMSALVSDLENRVASRTRDIQATQEITRYAASERDVQRLMNQVVELIVERFSDIYHAQIFLLDGDRLYAVVRASTGEVGQELMRRGHRLALGSVSVIGQVTEQGRLILARDTSTSQVHHKNEFLPDTRAELAIPLAVGDEVIGALDVQSKQPDAFNEDLIAILQTMAGQIAITIQNARLYEENSRRSLEIETANREATRHTWVDFMRNQRHDALAKEFGPRAAADRSALREQALREGRPITGALTERNTIPIAVPILLRGQTLGAVEWELPAAGFGEDQIELARELASRLAISLENARLFAESRRATERERQVNSIAAQLTTRSNLDDILRTAVREIGQALGSPQVTIRMQTTGRDAASNDNQPEQPSVPAGEPGA